MDREYKLSRLEFNYLALFIEDFEESLFAERFEEYVQVQLGQGNFKVTIP